MIAWLLACGQPPCEVVLADEVHTTAHFRMDGPPGRDLEVRYDPGDGLALSPPPAGSDDGRYLVDLIALVPYAAVSWEATLTGPRGGGHTCAGTFDAGGPGADAPALQVTVQAPTDAASAPFLVGTTLGAASGLFLVDRQGRVRWSPPPPDQGLGSPDIEPLPGSPSYLFTEQSVADRSRDESRLVRVDPAGRRSREIRTPLGHHTFAQGPDGAIAWLAIDVRPWTDPVTGETRDVVGDAVWILDADGDQRVLWNVWDHLTPVPDPNWETGFYPQGADWSHANGLNWSAARRSYTVSLGNARVVFEIDDTTGEVLGQYGGVDGYAFADGAEPFFHQHDARFDDDGRLWVATSRGMYGGSGAAAYHLDDDRRELDLVWSYGLDEDLRSTALGQTLPLEGGNVLVNYGGGGVIREVTPAGEVVWALATPSGSWFGNVAIVDDPYGRSAP